MRKPKLLDLFCCAGGAGTGYDRAGFEVVGIDIMKQPHYPFEFHQADAFEYLLAHGSEFDVIHASPPCQRYSNCTPKQYRNNHPDLISETRAALQNIGRPYVIENVRGAMRLLESPLMLCGTMFGLKVRRHRYFEIYPRIAPPILGCDHTFYPVLISGETRRKGGIRFEFSAQARRDAADLQWMTIKEMDEAIPPAYTEHIGRALIALLNLEALTTDNQQPYVSIWGSKYAVITNGVHWAHVVKQFRFPLNYKENFNGQHWSYTEYL